MSKCRGPHLLGVLAVPLTLPLLGSLVRSSSRGIIYAGNGIDFAQKAKEEAKKLQQEMACILYDFGI